MRQKFTSKERDNETGLDYFLARYYSSVQGRFTSPDEFSGGPEELYNFVDDAADNPTFYADLTNPQSLNKYQYTYNNPVNIVDPDGHCPPEAAALCRAAPVVFSIPGLREAAVGAAVVVILAKAIDAIPGDKTAGDGSCPSCERSLKAGQQRMERQEAARQTELKRQNDLDNLQQAQGGASGQPPKPEATGTTSSGRPTDRYGNPLGPSGREMRHDRDHPSRSRAQEAARRRGKGAPENHPNPTRGRGHFHPTGQDGKKVPNSTHENYPARSSHPKKKRTSPNE
ncbi:MAG: RHS repeat-associated core domain-containing protein [Acidobacteria bacterium]|nr:RHS repeat-associated core domain-containing protein [Acidobacteriota bacterium]